jgi:hypothetical protein
MRLLAFLSALAVPIVHSGLILEDELPAYLTNAPGRCVGSLTERAAAKFARY